METSGTWTLVSVLYQQRLLGPDLEQLLGAVCNISQHFIYCTGLWCEAVLLAIMRCMTGNLFMYSRIAVRDVPTKAKLIVAVMIVPTKW